MNAPVQAEVHAIAAVMPPASGVEPAANLPPATVEHAPSTKAASDVMLAALERGATPEQLEKMMNLMERWERWEALKAFNAALAAFKGEAIEILKLKAVSFTNNKGGQTEYNHEELYHVIEQAGPALSRHGFSWNWKHQQASGFITTTCYLRHRLGHVDECSLTAAYDSSGGKNPIQAVISAKSYLERSTLKSIAGLAAKNEDDDGAGSGKRGDAAGAPPADEARARPGSGGASPGAEDAVQLAYGEAAFAKFLPAWRDAIRQRKATPDQVIARIKSKGAISEQQIAAIRAPFTNSAPAGAH